MVHGVATVWLGHWIGGGFGRARPEVWGLVRGLSGVRAQATGSPVLGKGRWVLPVGQYPSLCTSGHRTGTRCSVCLASVCLALGLVPGPGHLSILEGRVGQDRGSPSSCRSVMRQPGHTQATWPAACKGLGPSCIGAVWTPLLRENRSMMIRALLMQRGWGAPHPVRAPAATAGATITSTVAHLSGQH